MKTQNTFLRGIRITGLVFALMLTTSALGSYIFANAQTGSTRSEIATDYLRSGSGDHATELKLSLSPGIYELSFWVWRSGALEPVSSLPVRGGPLVLFAHVEDENGNPAQSGTVTFEYCGDYEPKENCHAGLARWNRLGRISIGSCY